MGWYMEKTRKINGISKWDGSEQYKAYHEGWGGYSKKSYKKKKWLIKVADKVERNSIDIKESIKKCLK